LLTVCLYACHPCASFSTTRAGDLIKDTSSKAVLNLSNAVIRSVFYLQ